MFVMSELDTVRYCDYCIISVLCIPPMKNHYSDNTTCTYHTLSALGNDWATRNIHHYHVPATQQHKALTDRSQQDGQTSVVTSIASQAAWSTRCKTCTGPPIPEPCVQPPDVVAILNPPILITPGDTVNMDVIRHVEMSSYGTSQNRTCRAA
jgi:hypothetical protein